MNRPVYFVRTGPHNLPKDTVDVLPNGAYVYAPGKAPSLSVSPDAGRHTERGFEILDEERFFDDVDALISCYIPGLGTG